jgi:hypothetical protein
MLFSHAGGFKRGSDEEVTRIAHHHSDMQQVIAGSTRRNRIRHHFGDSRRFPEPPCLSTAAPSRNCATIPVGRPGGTLLECAFKLALTASLAFALAAWPRQLDAFSVAMCAGRGVEMEATFGVVVKLGRSGLQGAKVEIKASTTDGLFVTELTDKAGRALIRTLPPGDYWISVTYLGVSAGDHCFHVRARSSSAAKSTLRYRWGD